MSSLAAIARFCVAFSLTQAIEIPIYVRALGARPGKAFGASAITHPVVWFVMPVLWRALYLSVVGWDRRFVLGELGYFWGYGVLAEGFAVVVEAAYFRILGTPATKALGWSIAANATSSLAGLGIRAVTGWP